MKGSLRLRTKKGIIKILGLTKDLYYLTDFQLVAN